MNSPAFFLGEPRRLRDAIEKEAVLPEGEEPHWQHRHLAFEQRAQLIDCVGVCILAESTVGPPVSAERRGPSPQCLPKDNERAAFERN